MRFKEAAFVFGRHVSYCTMITGTSYVCICSKSLILQVSTGRTCPVYSPVYSPCKQEGFVYVLED